MKSIFKTIAITAMICTIICALTACSMEKSDLPENNQKQTQVISHSYEYVSAEQLKEEADIIFVGTYGGTDGQIIPESDTPEYEQLAPVYTNHKFNDIVILKGDELDTVTIRLAGGSLDDMDVVLSSAPKYTKNNKYIIYAIKGVDMRSGDTEHYHLIGVSSFGIDKDGKVDVGSMKTEDAKAIQEMYDSAVK